MCLGECVWMKATKGVSQPPEAAKYITWVGLLIVGGALCDRRHLTPLPPSSPSVFTGAQCVCCSLRQSWWCFVCVCLREKCCLGVEGLMGARALQGQCLCRARDRSRQHARTHTNMRTLAKNRGLLWTHSPVGSTNYSHTLYHPLPLRLFLSLIFLSLYLPEIHVCFSSSVASHRAILNLYSCFTWASDIVLSSHSYFTCLFRSAVSFASPFLSSRRPSNVLSSSFFTTASLWRTPSVILNCPVLRSHHWRRCEKFDSWIMEKDKCWFVLVSVCNLCASPHLCPYSLTEIKNNQMNSWSILIICRATTIHIIWNQRLLNGSHCTCALHFVVFNCPLILVGNWCISDMLPW